MSDRYRAGLANLIALSGDARDLVSDDLAGSVPEFVRLFVEVVFGELLARPGLDRRTRLLSAVGMVGALGADPTTLRWFVSAALSAGSNAEEVTEVLIQTSAFAGFTVAAKALETCRDLLSVAPESDCSCV